MKSLNMKKEVLPTAFPERLRVVRGGRSERLFKISIEQDVCVSSSMPVCCRATMASLLATLWRAVWRFSTEWTRKVAECGAAAAVRETRASAKPFRHQWIRFSAGFIWFQISGQCFSEWGPLTIYTRAMRMQLQGSCWSKGREEWDVAKQHLAMAVVGQDTEPAYSQLHRGQTHFLIFLWQFPLP